MTRPLPPPFLLFILLCPLVLLPPSCSSAPPPPPAVHLHGLSRRDGGLVPLISSPPNGSTVVGWSSVKVDLIMLGPEGFDETAALALDNVDVCLELDGAPVQCVSLPVLSRAVPAQAMYLQHLTPRRSPFKLKARLVDRTTQATVRRGA